MTAALLVMMVALAAAQEPTLTPVEETRAWQARRNESLSDNSGWLALAGLFPLSDGQFSLGAGTTSASSPPRRSPDAGAGRFLWADAPDAEGHTVLDFNRAYTHHAPSRHLSAAAARKSARRDGDGG